MNIARHGIIRNAAGLVAGLPPWELRPDQLARIGAQLSNTRTADPLEDLVGQSGPTSTYVLSAVFAGDTCALCYGSHLVQTKKLGG